jgi:hypothetical protein
MNIAGSTDEKLLWSIIAKVEGDGKKIRTEERIREMAKIFIPFPRVLQ